MGLGGAFDNQPDQIAALLGNNQHPHGAHERGDVLLYFCEDGGKNNGVHARDASGSFYTVFCGYPAHTSETTGLAFSPDKRHMYVAFQGDGVLYDIYRLDGHPFGGATLDVKYHEK